MKKNDCQKCLKTAFKFFAMNFNFPVINPFVDMHLSYSRNAPVKDIAIL